MQGDFLQETYEGGLKGVVRRRVEEFLSRQGLRYDKGIQYAVVLYDRQGEVAATGSLEKNVLKCIAVDEKWRGEGLTATVVSALLSQAFQQNRQHLFLFTKPRNKQMFLEFGFYSQTVSRQPTGQEMQTNSFFMAQPSSTRTTTSPVTSPRSMTVFSISPGVMMRFLTDLISLPPLVTVRRAGWKAALTRK